jgi:hypothetical protein
MRLRQRHLLARSLGLAAVLVVPASCKPDAASPRRLEDGRPQLPTLPKDMEEKLGDVYEAIKSRHSTALPKLSPAPATVEDHTAWVDGVLEPWRADGRKIGIKVNELRAEFQDYDAPENEVLAYERFHVVHAALGATLTIDENIARITIPLPESVRLDPEAKADLAKFGLITSKEMRDSYTLWRSSCTYAGGDEPTPPDLVPWKVYCFGLTDVLLQRTCDLERRLGVTADDKACEPPA